MRSAAASPAGAIAPTPVGGFVAPGFEPVAAAFAGNFRERGELGAAFAAVRDDEPLVDLWGGVADAPCERPWERDTLQVIFSGTKGLVAICLLLLIDRGRLSLEDPVSRHWPEFAARGKDAVTVRELVTHTARLPGITAPLTIPDLLDDRRMAALLAAQARLDDPRAARTYHALTYGWLCGELIRRIDGRSVGRFFAEEIAGPLELEVYIGLPQTLEPRVSRLELSENWDAAGLFAAAGRDELMRTVWLNPPILARDCFPWNDPRFHRAEIPGAGGIGTARAIAALYAGLDRLLSAQTLALARTPFERRREPLIDEPQCFGVGFELQTEAHPYGPPDDAFGHSGAGGSIHGAWPTQRVGFSYAMNLMRDDQQDGVDARSQALLGALHDCLDA